MGSDQPGEAAMAALSPSVYCSVHSVHRAIVKVG
ncbi:hypothetical protein WG78_07480 [Amantichitinum ursilacus]|uniref:Uncharacterized protein n=1 Tax=Amantichitinum ursilacus TaxID=857265 RepID=A0A0N0XKZ1_9NEIS|nr:hypothetical protein WG78_07480 [Amantichitinum ursilacus]